jgi:LacI family transcriptional regulator
MMEKRVTIKDIAAQAGVSLGTVHCALLGKKGVGAETRQRIIKIAKDANYLPNSSAAAIKRKQLRVAAAFPTTTNDNRFFYTAIWQGIRDFFASQADLNIRCIEVPFSGIINSYSDEITELMDHTEIHGLISVGFLDNHGKISLQSLIDKDIPVILVTNDIPLSGRLCCVQPDYRITGRMLAECITRQIPIDAGIMIWAGDVLMPSHYMIVEGFDSWLYDKKLGNPLYKIHVSGSKDMDMENMMRTLKQKAPAAACCINARGSVIMGNAIVKTGLAGKIVSVGCDIFEENLRFLRDGVFTNLIHKNAYLQAYMASKYMVNYLVKDIRPPSDLIYVNSEIIFESNASICNNGFTQLLL